MEHIIAKYGNRITSIGYNCFISRLRNKYDRRETEFFDYLGSSMRGIVECIDQDFKGSLNLVPFKDEKNPTFCPRYRIRCIHETPQEVGYSYNDFLLKKKRQRERFKESLNITKIFVRLNSNQNYTSGVDEEITWMLEFSKRLKQDHIIIFFTSYRQSNYENKILTINTGNTELTWYNCEEELDRLLNENLELIMSIL